MLVSIPCTACKSEHHDHYECSECEYEFGYFLPKYNYCPNCGHRLVKRLTDYKKRQLKERNQKLKWLMHKIGGKLTLDK